MTPTVRRAEPADAAAIRRVARAAWHAAYDDLIGADTVEATVEDWYAPDRLVADDIEPEARPVLVAVAEGTVVGFAEGAPDGDREGLAHLYRLYVTPERWGVGIGTDLLERLQSVLRGRGFARLEVVVLADNDVGVGFYEARGFERVGTRENDGFGVREAVYRTPL